VTSCARTPSWNRGHSQGDHPRRRRDVTSIRCGVPYSRLRAAAVRRDGRRRREGGPRLPRSGHACRRGHVVRRHVVHGARSARRHRLLFPGYRGERCLAAAHARPLIRPEDTLRQVVCITRTSRIVRRDAIQRDALLARPDVGRRSGDRGLRHRAVPRTRHRRGRASHGLSHGRPLTTNFASAPRTSRKPYMPAVTFSFRSAQDIWRVKTGNICISYVMPPCLQRQEHLHLDSVSIQLSVSIHIISVSLHAFLLLSSDYRSALLNFACYCILIRFSICRMILKSVASYSYAELRRNIMIRSAEYKEQSRIRSRSRRQS